MTSLNQIDFAALPALVKRQLLNSLTNPECLVYQLNMRGRKSVLGSLLWLGLFLLLSALVLANGFGDPLSASGVQGWPFVVVYCVVGAFIAYSVATLLHYYKLCRLLPFQPGLYVLPLTLIEAHDRWLKVYDLALLKKVEIVTHKTKRSYARTEFKIQFKDGQRYAFFVTDAKLAAALPARWGTLKAQALAAQANHDLQTLQSLDPLCELRSKKWKLSGVIQGAALDAVGSRPVNALVVGTLCAVLVMAGRNWASDTAMYRKATQQKTETLYLGYINHGLLKVAEIRGALPHVAFEEVQKQQSVTALKKLLQRYPNADLQNDVRTEIHVLYRKALEQYKKQASDANSTLPTIMERLLDFLEENGTPDVRLRFSGPSSSELEYLDQRLKERGGKLGNVVPASAHFSASSAAAREARIAAALRQGLQAIFPSDVLTLRVDNTPLGLTPLLDIAYDIVPSGAMHLAQAASQVALQAPAPRQFVGLVVRFKVTLVIPENVSRWKFELEVQPPQTFDANYQAPAGALPVGPPDSQPYAVMAARAFDQLSTQLRSTFFRPQSDAFIASAKQ